MFGNAIHGIKDWSNAENLALILNISKGCFTDEDNIIGSLFTTFIANNLDKLISPEDMVFGEWDKVSKRMYECVYDDNGNYKPSVASILHTRFLNYSMFHLGKKGSDTDPITNRLGEIINGYKDKPLFTNDLMYNIIKTMVVAYPTRMNKMMMNSKIRAIAIS